MNVSRRNKACPQDIEALQDILEGEIIFGSMAPGAELVEDSLMERFGAKRHVIRSMIQGLINRGIVEKERGRSARVKSFSPVEVDELYHMRAVLHREAVAVMPLPASLGDLRKLQAAHAAYEDAIDRGASALEIHRQNDRFHCQFFALCRNSLLCEMIQMLNHRSAPIRSHGIARRDWLETARREHGLMISALENGDRTLLADLVVEHMMPTRRIWEETHAQHITRVQD